MHRVALSILALLVATATVAIAQPTAGPTAASAKPATAKAKVIDITEADQITGDRPSGELVPISAREATKSSSLLRIRQDFIDLIVKTADQI